MLRAIILVPLFIIIHHRLPHCLGFTCITISPSFIPYPTQLLQLNLMRPSPIPPVPASIIFDSFVFGRLNRSPPLTTDTAHVRQSADPPQLPLPGALPSYRAARGSLSSTPRRSMAMRRLSPGSSRIVSGGRPDDGGYRTNTRMSG